MTDMYMSYPDQLVIVSLYPQLRPMSLRIKSFCKENVTFLSALWYNMHDSFFDATINERKPLQGSLLLPGGRDADCKNDTAPCGDI